MIHFFYIWCYSIYDVPSYCRIISFPSFQTGSVDIVIEAVEVCHSAAVHIEPPVTGEVLLIVQGSWDGEHDQGWFLGDVPTDGTEPGEAWLVSPVGTSVVDLTLGLGIWVVAWWQILAGECCPGHWGQVGVVSSGCSGNGADLLLTHHNPAQWRCKVSILAIQW